MLKLTRKNECPPDQFRFKFREDGYVVKCFDYGGWLTRLQEHRHFNGYPTPENWIAEAEDQLCKLLPPGWCMQETGDPPQWYIDARLSMADVIRGTAVLGTFMIQGMPLVDKEVAAARGAICAGCPFAMTVEGCGACAGLSNAIADIAGRDTLPSDTILANKSCGVCKCAARAQIWLPADILNKGVTDLMMQQFPDYCWKRNELLPIRNS